MSGAGAQGTGARAPMSRAAKLAVLVAALGYFVDIYDLILFSVVRVDSLRGLGVAPERFLVDGTTLINAQMIGMLLGGLLWGILGDKRGRLSVLFGSILLYSLANIANGLVQSVDAYAWVRFIAGVGLAGELGAGITLVSEVTDKERRGFATTIVATVGICGAIFAYFVHAWFDWRTAYFVGGGMGLALLALRVGVLESGMFARIREHAVARGNFLALFAERRRAIRYVSVILVGIPIWYAIGILVTFSPEIGKAMGMSPAPNAGRAVLSAYIGLAAGDFASGWLSQILRSRKRALVIFLGLAVATTAAYFLVGPASVTVFYVACGALGFATGYWAVFVTVASEQFGTNLRATATTTVPNFVRGAVVLLTLGFRGLAPSVGVVGSAVVVGVVSLAIAFVALLGLEETYGKDLDYLEE